MMHFAESSTPQGNRQPRRRRAAGFTLIELLITITILGILAGLALPSFRSFIARQKVRVASYELQSVMMYARSEALKRNTNVIITQTTGGWQNGWTVTQSTATLRQQGALGGVAITEASSKSSITFTRDGRANATIAFTINPSTSTSGVDPRCISLTLSGLPTSKTGGC